MHVMTKKKISCIIDALNYYPVEINAKHNSRFTLGCTQLKLHVLLILIQTTKGNNCFADSIVFRREADSVFAWLIFSKIKLKSDKKIPGHCF